MARRQIGQEQLGITDVRPRGGTSLDELAGLIDWIELDRLLAGISASTKGEPGWPPLALFRALLLATCAYSDANQPGIPIDPSR